MERKTLGAFLAVLRKAQGMTQKELAERIGVSDKTISHWERDESAPDISALPILADIFGVTVDELLRGEKLPQTDTTPEVISQKSEKELKYLLDKNFHKTNFWFHMGYGISAVGMLVAWLLYDSLAVSLAGVAAVFFIIASCVCGIGAGNFNFAVKAQDFTEEMLAPYRKNLKYRWLLLHLLNIDLAVIVWAIWLAGELSAWFLLLPIPTTVALIVLLVKKKEAFKD